MICKNKIGNLHTSYEKNNDFYHLKAFFGVNVSCAMQEILKFPGLFDLKDVKDYLDDVSVIPKRKSMVYLEYHSQITSKFLAEEQRIKPKILSNLDLENGIFYFYFDQLFEINKIRKYKVQISVNDKSIIKALEVKEKIIDLNTTISKINNEEEITEELKELSLFIVNHVKKIQKKHNDFYDNLLKTRFIDIKILKEISRNLKKEIRYINDTLNIKNNFTTKTTQLAELNNNNAAIGPINMFEKEFKKEISFSFEKEFKSALKSQSFSGFPIIKNNLDSIDFSLINKLKTRKINNVPSFETTYKKQHSYDYKQNLEKKAENYNLNFVNKIDEEMRIEKKEFIIDKIKEPIYVLIGHNKDNVTSEIFVPIEQIRQNLKTNSNYLCKTEMIEAENQYFILEA